MDAATRYCALFLALSATVAMTTAIVCAPDYCASEKCEEVESCPNGYIKPDGTFCGCCPACITYIAENKSCALTLIRGPPPTQECGPGLQCNNGVCIKR